MAIAYDASGQTGSTLSAGAGDKTFSSLITVGSGSNRILFFFFNDRGAFGVSGEVNSVTWHGQSMTLLSYNTGTKTGAGNWVYYLLNPDAGANNFVVNTDHGSYNADYAAVSYTGAQQSGVPDATAYEGNGFSATEVSPTITVVSASAWVVLAAYNDKPANFVAGTNATLRTPNGRIAFLDSNANTGAGSFTIQGTWSGTASGDGSAFSFVAAATAPTVTTSATSAITSTTATGNGNVTDDGGSAITERGVCWSTSANPTTSDSKATASGTTGVYTASITGLSPSTTYHVRAYAINAIGTSYGSDDSFVTLAAASAAMPSSLLLMGCG